MVKGSVPGQSQRRCFGSVAPPTVSRGVVGGAVDSAAIDPAITSVTWISIEAGRTRDRDLTGAASEPRRFAASLSAIHSAIHVRSLCRIQSNQRPRASHACGTGYRQGRTLWFASGSAAAVPFRVAGSLVVRSGGDGRVGSDVGGWRADS